jgi:hypothetical protein
MRPRALYGAVACACALAVLSSDGQAAHARDTRPVAPLASDAALGTQRLSDEQTITRYANAVARGPIRRRPSVRAPRVASLRYQTEDGPLETYLALESRVDAPRTWVRIRIAGRPNGRTGWVDRDDLGPLLTVTTMLRIDRRTLQATLYGFTDVVKRPTSNARQLRRVEFDYGRQLLAENLDAVKPKVVIVTFREAAARLFGKGTVPGITLAGADVFVMPGPYERRAAATPLLDELATMIRGA